MYLKLPREGFTGVENGSLSKLHKGAYGLANAPHLWWRELRRALLEVGFEEMKLLPCAFVARSTKNKFTYGILAVNVDNIITAGNELFEGNWDRFKQRFSFGVWQKGEFDYTGPHFRQLQDYSIQIAQANYGTKIPRVTAGKLKFEDNAEVTAEVKSKRI